MSGNIAPCFLNLGSCSTWRSSHRTTDGRAPRTHWTDYAGPRPQKRVILKTKIPTQNLNLWSSQNTITVLTELSQTSIFSYSLCYFHCTWFQASVAVQMRSSFFWDVTQRRLVVTYRRFGKTYRSHFQGPTIIGPIYKGQIGWPLKRDRMSRNVRNYHPRSA